MKEERRLDAKENNITIKINQTHSFLFNKKKYY